MRRVSIKNPFRAGMVTDLPAHAIGEANSAFAQDLVAPEGVSRQRRGWAFDGTQADAASNLVGVWRAKFILAGVTYTVTSASDGTIRIHNAAGAGTTLFVDGATVKWLPRCVYGDELIFCAQDGVQGIARYAGAISESDTGTVSAKNSSAGKSTLTAAGAGQFGASVLPGYYIPTNITNGATGSSPYIYVKVLERISNTVLSGAGIKTSAALALGGGIGVGVGNAAQCVSVYDAGTGTISGASPISRFTGTGVKWTTGAWGVVRAQKYDALLVIKPAATSFLHYIDSVADNILELFGVGTSAATDTNYAILRNCPFTDAQAHKGSFWGTGVAQYPENVYVGPPGWNISFPPGFVLPYDPSVVPASTNINDFLMDVIPVPSANDGDPVMAILSSPNPLLVIKRKAVYGIYGSYPNFSVDKIIDGAGCIDKRSAISAAGAQFWAGENGIYAYVGGRVIDLTDGKINQEWRALTKDFDYGVSDYCTIGETNNYLLVSITTGGGVTKRTYCYDLLNKAWASRFTNHAARYFHSSRISGERGKLFWVGDSQQGRVMESSVCIDGSGIARDGDATAPRMQAWTGEGVDTDASLTSDSRILDLTVSANVTDVGSAGSTRLGVSVVTGGSVKGAASATKTLAEILSDNTAVVGFTRYREVNAPGRLHQIRVDVPTLGTNAATTKVEIHEISATFRGRRDRT